ncbi:tetratricopeptide repeat protein [Baaleninema sp.]|uniref:tetratricopeptide repeat protein n=1 Tax=Baaleninema sp. TaxID=3101197 RepID=UPI003D040381
MLRRIVQAIANFFRRLFGGGAFQHADRVPVAQPPLSDAECEFYFLQLLEGVSHGWDETKIDRFFQALDDRASEERWMTWLRQFGNARTQDETPQVELGRRMVQLSDRTSRPVALLAGNIGHQLLAGASPAELSSATEETATEAATPTPSQAPATRGESETEEARRWLSRGTEQLKGDRFEAALLAFDRALALDDTLVRAWIGRGDALAELKRSKEALAAYQKAAELDPGNAQVWGHLGDLQQDLKQVEAALVSWDKALELDPKDIQTWINKGVVLGLDLNRWEDALATWEKALELDGNDAQIWFRRGVAFGAMERWDEAVESWDKALELDPYFRDAWINKGVALQKLGRYEEAIEANNRALGLDAAKADDAPPAEPTKAKSSEEKAKTPDPEQAESLYRQGLQQYDAGNLHPALKFLDRALEADADNLKVWQQRGRILRELQQFEEAIDCCDRALEKFPDDLLLWWTRTLSLQQLQRWEEANSGWDKVLELQPMAKDAWIHKGIALEKLGRYSEAIEANKRAM